MRHLAQTPCRELPVIIINVSQEFLVSLVESTKIKVVHWRYRLGGLSLVLMVELRNYRTVVPCENLLIEKWRSTEGDPNALCVVAQLLELQIGNVVVILIDERKKETSNVLCCVLPYELDSSFHSKNQ